MGIISIYESEVPCMFSTLGLQQRCETEKLVFSEETNRYLLYSTLEKIGPSVAQKAVSKLVERGEITWNEEEAFEVEHIVDHVVEEGTTYYLIKWKGWSSRHNSWEPKENISCDDLVAEFHRLNSEMNSRKQLKRRYDHISSGEDVQQVPKRIRIDLLFHKLMTCKEMTPSRLMSLMSPDKGKSRSYRGVVHCEGLRVPKFNSAMKNVLNPRTKAYKEKKLEIQKALKDWERHLNSVNTDPARISVENEVDLEGPPENFVYINDYKPGKGIEIPDDPIIGCSCENCVSDKSCCPSNFGVEFPYYKRKRLRIPEGRPIYECNKRCKCGPECSNRVVQLGRKHRVCIFRTNNGRGWGVKATQKIKAGSFVIEYVGEVISNEEAEIRGKTYDSVGRTYLFDLDFNDDDCDFTVDAAEYGNVSHFINHSCDPNLKVYSVWINTLDPRMPRIALFSCKDIKRGEELTFDYMSAKKSSSNTTLEHNDTSISEPETVTSNVDVVSSNVDVKTVTDEADKLNEEGNELNNNGKEKLVDVDNGVEKLVDNVDSETGKGVNAMGAAIEGLTNGNSQLRSDESEDMYRMVCQCGAKKCRKFVF